MLSILLVAILWSPPLHAESEGEGEESPTAASETSDDETEAEPRKTSASEDSGETSDEGDSDDAASIVEDALATNSLQFESARAEFKLTIEGDNGDTSERQMVVQSAEVDGAVRTRIELTAPPDVEGQAFLFAENESGADDVWMYVPAFSVTRRIEGSKKQGSFLGSHFTYNDLESRSIEAADYQKTGTDEIGGHEVWVIEATPRDEAESAYGTVVTHIRKKDRAPLKFEFLDEDDEPVKTLYVEKLATTDSGTTYIKQMRMQSDKGGYSRIAIESLETDADVPTSIFNKEQLGQ
jgi:outer membrane lipoprotein-sorting protein